MDCIIPVYNEQKSLEQVVTSVCLSPYINKVVVVDDGSTDSSSYIIKQLQKKYSKVVLVSHRYNRGKSSAIKTGLQKTSSKNILLLDSDLKNLNTNYLNNLLSSISKASIDFDQIILVSTAEQIPHKLLKSTKLLSGQRVVKRDLLKKALKLNPKGYQIEVALNKTAIKNKSKSFYYHSALLNYRSYQKMPLHKAVYKELKMFASVVWFMGPLNYLYSYLFFCSKKLIL